MWALLELYYNLNGKGSITSHRLRRDSPRTCRSDLRIREINGKQIESVELIIIIKDTLTADCYF